MLRKLRERIQSEEKGFTLIELLGVVLIIGILAAIAIRAFLSQTDKADDAAAKSAARNAQTAAETYMVDNNGSHVGMTAQTLADAEPTLNEFHAGGHIAVAPAPTADTYTIRVTSPETSNTFSVSRGANGAVTRGGSEGEL